MLINIVNKMSPRSTSMSNIQNLSRNVDMYNNKTLILKE